MKKYFLSFIFITVFLSSNAQNEADWTGWVKIYDGVFVSYNVSDFCRTMRYSYYRTRNDIQRNNAWVIYSFEFLNCKGEPTAESNLKIDLSKVGVTQEKGLWFPGDKITKSFFGVKYEDYNVKPTGNQSTTTQVVQNSQYQSSQSQLQQQNQTELARQQQLQSQLNQIQNDYDNNTRRIESLATAQAGLIGALQANMIQKNIQNLNNRRSERYRLLREQLGSGGTLDECHTCSHQGTVLCQTCQGNPITSCRSCGGSGKMVSFGTTMACNVCGGTGRSICTICGGVGITLCYDCSGAGYKAGSSYESMGTTNQTNSTRADFGYGDRRFPLITVNNRLWGGKNLNVDHFANGDKIFHATNAKEWSDACAKKQPAWCHYDYSDYGDGTVFGKLYNWYAAADPRGACPVGWHVSSSGELSAGMKQIGSDFPWKPSGFVVKNNKFSGISKVALWWGLPAEPPVVVGRDLGYGLGVVFRLDKNKEGGYPILCIQDFVQEGAQVKQVASVIPDADFGYGEGVSKSATIGQQQWVTFNLNTDHFANGDVIPEVKSEKDWKKAGDSGKPAWCYYKNDPANAVYGKLYNWYAIADSRNVCPSGWHVSSEEEWEKLALTLGGGAGAQLKSIDSWTSGNSGKDLYNFSALPGGFRSHTVGFSGFKIWGQWWTSSENGNFGVGKTIKDEDSEITSFVEGNKTRGASVRCIRDK